MFFWFLSSDYITIKPKKFFPRVIEELSYGILNPKSGILSSEYGSQNKEVWYESLKAGLRPLQGWPRLRSSKMLFELDQHGVWEDQLLEF